ATLETEPAPPSQAWRDLDRGQIETIAQARNTSAERLRRHLQGDLANIVARALRKDPRERYATAAEFADDLRRYRADLPVRAHRDAFGYRLAKFVRRRRALVATAAIVLLASGAGVAGTWLQAHRAEVALARAVRELEYSRASSALLS